MKTQYLCFPLNIKPTTTTTNTTTSPSSSSSSAINGRVPPTSSLLDRFREAVFRLIMVTALTKASNNSSSKSTSSRSSTSHNDYGNSNNNHGHESVRRSCYLYDPYHSEALADCIEFIKKKSVTSSPSDDDQCRLHDHVDYDDDDNETSCDSTALNDVIIPLPIM